MLPGGACRAFFNGMATAADWISAANFHQSRAAFTCMASTAVAYIMGWTGGYCLVALLIAPYLRKSAQFTIPDFLAARYGGGAGGRGGPVRAMAVGATIIVSFIYVVAQIYAVGLIASRFTGVDFSVGIFLGLASILVCSFLGGMRAITWTQVAQYIIILVAFLLPPCGCRSSTPPTRCRRWRTARCCRSWRHAKRNWPSIRRKSTCASAFTRAPTCSQTSWQHCRRHGTPAAATPSVSSTRCA